MGSYTGIDRLRIRKTTMSSALRQMLHRSGEDLGFRTALRDKDLRVLADYDLSTEEIAALRSGDENALYRLLEDTNTFISARKGTTAMTTADTDKRLDGAILDGGRRVAYVTSGHPLVLVTPAQLILKKANEERITVDVIPGVSSLDTVWADFRVRSRPRRGADVRGNQPATASVPADSDSSTVSLAGELCRDSTVLDPQEQA
jgi:siroheme synthase